MSRFYFGGSDESESEAQDNDDYLPFPKPLSRNSFVSPDFDAASFLSSLSNRHQSLADLQTELRELSQSLSKELLDLVNENYQDFLSLGTALKGGEGKVEEIRTVLLSFQRDVQTVKEQYESRTVQLRELLAQKKQFRSDIEIGHDLLDIAERVELLEQKLLLYHGKESGKEKDLDNHSLESADDDSEVDEDEDTDKSEASPLIALRRLERRVQQYLALQTVVDRVGEKHPFVKSQLHRVKAIKEALLLDLNAATKQTGTAEESKQDSLLKLLHLHELLGEETQAIMTMLKLRL